MVYSNKLFILLAVLLAGLSNCGPPEEREGNEAFSAEEVWPDGKITHKPWTRWWWMGSAVDKRNIDRLLGEYARTGIGGVEIAPIYGAVGYENRYLDFLSPEWMEMLDFTVETADSLNMGVDMTQGTGWPFGGPQVTPQYAATKLIVQVYTLKGGQVLQEKVHVRDPDARKPGVVLQAVVAYNQQGESRDLTGRVSRDGVLDWTPESGSWKIYAAFAGKTGQKVKRAAPGGAGYTLDHFSQQAVEAYLDRFDEVFSNYSYQIRAFYNDSYEVYGANWTPGLFDEFEKRRGYDLRDHLPALVSNEKSAGVARLKADYRETLSDMLLENFTVQWTDWTHRHQALSKNQAHGSPGNFLDLYAAVDIPEGETFGSSYFPVPGLRRDSADIRHVDPDPIMLKFASSGAHASGNNLVSCETFTWLGEHFKTSFSQCKPEVEQVFLSGVNHVFYHGVTYSPENVPWPGWLFYASLNLTPANSLWPHLKGLNTYIARCQSVLQSGKSDNELAIYWPVYDIWTNPEGMDIPVKVHNIDEWLHPTPFYAQARKLMDVGYSVDFVSDRMLGEATVGDGEVKMSSSGTAHKVLIIPETRYMPVSTLESIIGIARKGATVIFEALPEDVSGFHKLPEKRQEFDELLGSLQFTDAGNGIQQMEMEQGLILLAKDVRKSLEYKGVLRETLTDTGLDFIRRKTAQGKYYYIVNHTPDSIDTAISLNVEAASVIIMDPQYGKAGLAQFSSEGDKTKVRVQVKPGEAFILYASTGNLTLDPWQYTEETGQPLEIAGEWTLRFTGGGPHLPGSRQLDRLVSWTELSDTAEAFSGTAEYTTTFTLPARQADTYLLDLGNVRESARVWVNGREVGIVWSIPFQVDVGRYLKEGENTLTVEVANLMANRIRYMDRQGIEWRKYHEINFVNIDYKPFDASNWEPVPSGLMGPVRLIPCSVSGGQAASFKR